MYKCKHLALISIDIRSINNLKLNNTFKFTTVALTESLAAAKYVQWGIHHAQKKPLGEKGHIHG